MADRMEFTAKLAGILEKAKGQQSRMSHAEVEEYFKEDNLSQEQLALVCEYLMSQKVIVSGFTPRMGEIKEEVNQIALKGKEALSKAERDFAEDYLKDLKNMHPKTEEEELLKDLMPQVVEIAMELKRPEIPLGDLVQEGSVALLLGTQKFWEPAEIIWEDEETEEDAFMVEDDTDVLDLGDEDLKTQILEEVRAAICTMIEEQTETKARDRKMVSKVSDLDEIIQKMKDDFGRKVSVEEVAEQSGLSPEEIADILKLAGEETPEDVVEDGEITELFHVVENGQMPKE